MSLETFFLTFIAAFGALMAVLFVVTSRSGRRPASRADPLVAGALGAENGVARNGEAAQSRSRPGRTK